MSFLLLAANPVLSSWYLCAFQFWKLFNPLFDEETMENNLSYRKRPCRVCGIWFVPHPRLKDRQKTCAHPACKKEWHRKQCKKWNSQNRDYFKANYLQKKLHAHSPQSSGPKDDKKSCERVLLSTHLPSEVIIHEIGLKQFIILDYVSRSLLWKWQRHYSPNRKKSLHISKNLPP